MDTPTVVNAREEEAALVTLWNSILRAIVNAQSAGVLTGPECIVRLERLAHGVAGLSKVDPHGALLNVQQRVFDELETTLGE